MSLTRRPYREVRLPSLAGGMNDTDNQTLLRPDQTPRALNVDFNRETVRSAAGALKFNNQVAPQSAFRSRVDPSYAPLYVQDGMGVPLRGYGYLPYASEYDVAGGDFAADLHSRRGRNFELNVTVRIPPEERLYEAPTKGTGAPATPDSTFNPPHGYDEALDECFCIVQKGGDRTAPMSWALAVVNIGSGAGTSAPASRVSNYALCWIWFDAPGWGQNSPSAMKYNLTTAQNPVGGAAAQFSTQALRALLIYKFVEPGKRYHVAVQAKIDTGSSGATAVNTAWNHDGYFKVWVSEDGAAPTSYTAVDAGGGVTLSGMEVYKGPTDSARYLCKYGVRYSARDAMFLGLGLRSHVWRKASFIPWGMDAAPVQFGGYRMIDRSASTAAQIYGGGIYTLTATKALLADSFVEINHRGFANGNTNGGTAPMGFWGGSDYLAWAGLNAGGAGSTPFNTEALRGYRLVTTADFTPGTPDAKGMVLNVLTYTEVALGGPYRVNISSGTSIGAFSAMPILVQAFRWHQRELEIGEFRIWSDPRVYDDADAKLAERRKFSLRSSVDITDATEPDLATLLARWGADDAGGSVLREAVVGGRRAGYFAPFGLGVSEGGSRGKNLLFLSGEGEAVRIAFDENPVAMRVLTDMLGSTTQGFAVEMTCVIPEAYYAIQGPGENLPDGGVTIGARPRFVPDLITWDVVDPDDSGFKSKPRSILALTHRALRNDQNQTPFMSPVPWSVEVAQRTDQEDIDAVVHSDLLPWYVSGAADVSRYDRNALWVGKPITIQVGIQPVAGTPDSYDVYVAMRPKNDINPVAGDAGDSEFAYYSKGGTTYDVNPAYFAAAHITIRKKDLARSVITIGGRLSPRSPPGLTAGLGCSELNARIVLDEVRVFATAAPGTLPATNGAATSRDGKLSGLRCLPPRLLTREEILLPLGRGVKQVNAVEGSSTVTPSGGGKFFTSAPADTTEAVKETMLVAKGDLFPIPSADTVGEVQEQFYRVASVATDGSSLTLAEPFEDATRSAGAAAIFRLLFYTAFAEDLSQVELSLGAGVAYNPATSTVADALIVERLWANLAPVTANAGLRIYSPLGRGTLADILPFWVRGLVAPRRNPILGITGRSGDILCGARGAIFQGDDRWRDTGPTTAIQDGLAFRARVLPDTAVALPLHDDRLRFTVATPLTLTLSGTDAFSVILDAWVKLDELAEYQTIFWVGDPETDPATTAGSGAHKVHLIMRLRRGVPELVVGSSASPTPEKGLYIASGSTSIDRGKYAHVRWYIATRTGGTVVKIPKLKINGRTVDVTVNAQDSGIAASTASDWIRASQIVQPGASGRILVGVARDAYRAPSDSPSLTSGVEQIPPQRMQGYMHSLGGVLSELVSTNQTPWSGSTTGSEPPNFDPFNLSYAAALATNFRILGALSEGVGHKVLNQAIGGAYGLIQSSPFVSIFHEFGRETNPISWAEIGSQVYATNGARPVVISGSRGRFAGVLPPITKPNFTLQRLPVWKPNERDKATSANTANDPIDAAAVGAAVPINHYETLGNAYFKQKLSSTDQTSFAWSANKYFAFKTYWRPASVHGRVSIWRRGQSKESGGPFVECRDGKLVFGWYDTLLKKEVSVETTGAVFTPGAVHYIHIRKRWPQDDRLEGNWVNSYFSGATLRRIQTTTPSAGTFAVNETISNGGNSGRVVRVVQPSSTVQGFIEYTRVVGDFGNGVLITGGTSGATATTLTPVGIVRPMQDLCVVRKLRTTVATSANVTELDEVNPIAFGLSLRNAISFTTETAQSRPVGTTATGLASLPGGTFSTNASPGNIVSSNNIFHPQHVGMYFQFGTGSFAGRLYRIIAYNGASNVDTVLAGTTTAEVFGVASGLIGGVFSGIGLVKSDSFDSSKSPDQNGDVEFAGSSIQGQVLSGFSPHQGELWTPGWTCVTGTNGENAQVFENIDSSHATGTADPVNTGCDSFDEALYDGVAGEPGELRYNGAGGVNEPATPTATFWTTDARTFNAQGGNASSQANGTPSTSPSIAKDPTAIPRTTASKAANPTVEWIQRPDSWAKTRYITTAFYDPAQNAVSNPGPPLTISASDEDPQNPSGTVRLLLTDLPQRPGHELWIYESLGGGSQGTMFRVARFDAQASQFAVVASEDVIGQGPALSFDNFPPPSCKVIGSSGTRLWFGALTALRQLDGVMYSKAGAPVSLRLTPTVGFFRLASGAGDEITGLQALDEFMLLAKDRALGVATVEGDDLPRVDTLSGGIGGISPSAMVSLDNRVYFLSDRGLHLVSRGSGTNLGVPVHVSTFLENYFSTVLDKRYARVLVAAINRARDQYVIITREVGATRAFTRISMEHNVQREGAELQAWTSGGHRFSRYETPYLSAIGQVQSSPGGPERFVGGTDDGFLVWMDRDDTQGVFFGTAAVWGAQLLVASSGASSAAVPISSGALDTDLEGPRGATMRYLDAGAVERSVALLGASSTVLLLDESPPAAIPTGGTLLLGVLAHSWETGWFTAENLERKKLWNQVNLDCRKESSGTLLMQVYVDKNDTTPVVSRTVTLSDVKIELQLESLEATWLKLKFTAPFPNVGTRFDLAGIVVRPTDVDQS